MKRVTSLFWLLLVGSVLAEFDFSQCGVTKGCWVPDTLCWGGDCNGMAVSYRVIDDAHIEFELRVETKLVYGVYVAVGFSDDYYMGNESVLECSSIGKQPFSMKFSYNGVYDSPEDNTNSRLNDNQDDLFKLPSIGYENGVLYCKSTVVVNSNLKNYFNYQPDQQYYLLLVSGKTSATGLTHHDFDSTSPPTYLHNRHIGFNNQECSKSKGCVIPNNCNGMGMSHKVLSEDKIQFEIFGNVDTRSLVYVAIGFSSDQKMGGESVLECSQIGSSLSMKFSYNDERPSNVRIEGEEGIRSTYITNTTAYIENGYLYCSAIVTVCGSSISHEVFKWDSDASYYMLFATGPTNQTVLAAHTSRCTSSVPIRLQDVQPNFDTSSCSKTKACVIPTDCPEGCDGMMASYRVAGNFQFEIELTARQSSMNRYVAIGFSTSGGMGNSSVIECSSINGDMYSMKYSYNYVAGDYYGNNRTTGDVSSYIKNETVTFSDGILYCKGIFNVSYDTPEPLTFKWWPGHEYNILLAEGATNKDGLTYHDMKTVSSSRYLNEVNPTEPPPPSGGSIFDKTECGVSKGCYLPNGMADFGVSYRIVSDDVIDLELVSSVIGSSPLGNYVAVGFSTNSMMKKTPVIECSALQGASISMKFSYNDDNVYNNRRIAVDTIIESKFNEEVISFTDGIIYCRALVNVSGNADARVFKFNPSQQYNLLLAKGTTSNTGLTKHTVEAVSTARLLSNLGAGDDSAGTSKLIIAHAVLMTLAWYVFVPTALLFARVLRSCWPTLKPGGLLIWFHVHRTSNLLAIAMMVAAFILVMTAKDWLWVKPASSWGGKHAILGLISLILAWLQPFISTLRCTPDNPRRPLFNRAHRAIGIAAFIFATSAIGIAAFHFTKGNAMVQLILAMVPLVLVTFTSLVFLYVDKRVDIHDRNIQKIQRIRQISVYLTIICLVGVAVALCVLFATGL